MISAWIKYFLCIFERVNSNEFLKINKPYLPLVTGEISTDLALACISLCLSVGLYYGNSITFLLDSCVIFCFKGVTTNSASIMFTLVGRYFIKL
jgi:hypothetical protein